MDSEWACCHTVHDTNTVTVTALTEATHIAFVILHGAFDEIIFKLTNVYQIKFNGKISGDNQVIRCSCASPAQAVCFMSVGYFLIGIRMCYFCITHTH